MDRTRPFFDQKTGNLDTAQLKAEVFPIVKLLGLFLLLGLGLFVIGLAASATVIFFGILFVFAAYVVLILGVAIVLMYTIARAIQLAGADGGTTGSALESDETPRSDETDRH